MFIGQSLSLETHLAARAERWAANTTMATAAASTAASAAASTASASPPFFALSPPAKMDSIAALPPGESADGPSPAIASSWVTLVYAEEFYLEHNGSLHALLVLCQGLTHDDGMPAIDV